LTSFAEEQAEAFLHPPNRQKALTSAQLRRFYHEVKALEAKIEAGGFEANAPLVKMLRSKVAYACPAKGDKKIPNSFAEFLWKHIEQVRSEKDFKAFCTVFEAVVGFFYGKGGR
jgi:CRISPR type III-A-associated protein Csm2